MFEKGEEGGLGMKVLGIVCSPRKGGNTEIMMREALTGARNYEAETELWTTAGKDLKPCDGCGTCLKRDHRCHIEDDMQELYPKVLTADGIIFGSPVYFWSATAQAKIVIDRLYSIYNKGVLPGKVAGVISVAGARGHDGVQAQFNPFIQLCHMLLADSTYGFADDKGAIRKDEYAMKSSEELGKAMVSLIKQQLHWPEEYRKALYRICKDTYGIDSYPLKRFKISKSIERSRNV